MIASIVGNYLKDVGLLTEEQLYDLLAEHRKVRAKLGIIAVAEGLMTQEEADRVNRLQAIMDMRLVISQWRKVILLKVRWKLY